jgi:hypothetical protein
MNHRDRIAKAIENYSKRNSREPKAPQKKNKSPEKDLVKELLDVALDLGLSLDVVESKATFSQATGRYTGSAMKAGIPDIIGCDSDGISVWIEAKAPGRLSTLRDNQRAFLETKIRYNAFAVVVDCPDKLREFYRTYKKIGPGDKAQAYLRGLLPVTRSRNYQKNQSSEDLGF